MMIKQEERFDYKGYPCVILFMSFGHRCGYVGVPIEKSYNIDIDDIDCHGGVTYCEEHLHYQEDKNIKWIGFDTGHYGDGRDFETVKKLFGDNPKILNGLEFFQGSGYWVDFPVRTLDYCKEQCKQIVEQIIEMEN